MKYLFDTGSIWKMKGDGMMLEKVLDLLKKEKLLAATGGLGLLLGLLCQGYILLFGAEIGVEGNLSKAVSFNVALGMFLLTTALILPFAQLSKRFQQFFRWAYFLASMYSYGLETIQHLRGIDPRFTQYGSTLDQILGMFFGIVAVIMVIFYSLLALFFFRQSVLRVERAGLVIGIRYG
ncbi:hypothetical protein [Caldalkalibacillus mannanilyticus]|uniref:hypothetical protein n=1 Tax=Caldalkalibacillus mannanilyticus TaxID=1418 RepID=UPI000686927C|nr:hypothetical protein [Caldalkalibacillus mannanilyticus]